MRPETADGIPLRMRGRQGRRRSGPWCPGRVLFVLSLLTALLFGPALGGAVAWIHSHGDSGGHLHLLPDDEQENEVAALDGWHDAQHRCGHDGDGHADGGPAPRGFLIELPAFAAAAPRGSTVVPAASAQAQIGVPRSFQHLAIVESSTPQWLIRSGWPPHRTNRSGVAALLRSSHAILI